MNIDTLWLWCHLKLEIHFRLKFHVCCNWNRCRCLNRLISRQYNSMTKCFGKNVNDRMSCFFNGKNNNKQKRKKDWLSIQQSGCGDCIDCIVCGNFGWAPFNHRSDAMKYRYIWKAAASLSQYWLRKSGTQFLTWRYLNELHDVSKNAMKWFCIYFNGEREPHEQHRFMRTIASTILICRTMFDFISAVVFFCDR